MERSTSTARWARIAGALLALAFAARSAAEEPVPPASGAGVAAPSTVTFEPIVVTATRLPAPLGQVPASVSVIEGLDIQGAQRSVGLEESLDRVPGVLVQSSENFAQDARIQIRGFGTRSAFGIREIRVLVDGLPETQPDGQTQIDDVDLGSIGRIEVLRGPAGALYGNASGGVIQLFTEEAPDRPTIEVVPSGGSYGLAKVQVKGGAQTERAQLYLFGSYLQLDGYREQSATESGTFYGKLRYALTDATDATLLVAAVDSPEGDDPGALTREEVCDDPRAANPRNVMFDASETVSQVRVGTVVDHHAEWSDLSGYAYVIYRDFDNLLPIAPAQGDGVVTFTRVAPGGGLRWSWHQPVFGLTQVFTVGFDAQYQDDDRRRFQNNNGERGDLGLHQQERVGSFGPYLREAVEIIDDLELSAGVRYDLVDFDVDVDFPSEGGDQGSRTFHHFSPTGGVRWSPSLRHSPGAHLPRPSELSVFFTVGTAFQTPTTTELANPTLPGFNPDVEPQTSITYEIGSRTQWSDVLQTGLSGYLIDVDDELVPFESESGRTAFRNAGRSRRLGLELDWQARPSIGPFERTGTWGGFRLSGALTLLDAKYTEYVTDAGDFDGNDEPGIPQWWIYQEVLYRHPSGFFSALEVFAVDGYFVDDANNARNDSYAVLNLRAGYERTFGNWRIAPFVGLNNLNDANYVGTTRLNALNGRYYEPAPRFNAYGGISVSVTL
jgi:iron complex outermembrane receptor protein